MTTKQRSILEYVGCRVDIETVQSEKIVGKLLAYDKAGNLILSDAEMHRTTKKGKTIIESLGMMFLRGAHVQLIKVQRSLTRSRTVIDSRTTAIPQESQKVVLDASKLLRAQAQGLS